MGSEMCIRDRYNSPPNFPPDVPRGRFPNGPRHALSANYPYGPGNMEYSGWGAATGHWLTPPEGAHGHGLGGYERSFGGEVGGRYGSGHPPDHGDYFQQERETTGENYNYGLSAAGPEAPDPRLYGVGYDIPVDSGNQQQQQQQQQQHQHQQDRTPPATSTSAATPSPAPGAAPANGAPPQLFIARSVHVGKSESGDSVAVDRDGVVRGSVVGRVDSELITRIASALRCTPGQPRPDGSEE